MKTVVLGFCMLILLGVMSLFKLNFKPFLENKTPSSITIYYKDQTHALAIEPYETLATILERIPLDTDVDHQAINPQQILHHGDAYTIPQKKESPCVSINSALVDELVTLKGVGPATATRIVEHRQHHGLFQTVEDLMNVKGIGPKKFEAMRELLCI